MRKGARPGKQAGHTQSDRIQRAITERDGLRRRGIIVETDYMDRSVKAQMKYANKLGAKKTVIIGTQELEDNRAKVKDMETGEQVEVRLDEIAAFILGK